MNTQKQLQLYCKQMEAIKYRIDIAALIAQQKMTLGNQNLDYAFSSVQLRKILELIAFSSLIANKEKYSKIHKNYTKHFSAKRILQDIEKLNQDFFPKPVVIDTSNNKKIMHLGNPRERHKIVPLNREEFIELYEICSSVIHTANPYGDNPKQIDFKRSLDDWLKKIAALLDSHVIRLVDSKDFWLIIMKDHNKKSLASAYHLKALNVENFINTDS
ncbi:MAG: hypothetical protein CO093_03170 [Alphaproteobacteria bacterium CG_4_9_14_3_um_filter_47_13]|nr:MAG: hypothetical protein CO093_03170 [Alphaproteobacteria bacterium CG_4_9_14_3_um_filter_47_13]